jgi:hypothetical protein
MPCKKACHSLVSIGLVEGMPDMWPNVRGAGIMLVIGICILLAVSRPKSQPDKMSRRWIPLVALFSGPAMVILWFSIEFFVVHRNNRVLAGDAWALLPPVMLIATFVSVVASIVIAVALYLQARFGQ